MAAARQREEDQEQMANMEAEMEKWRLARATVGGELEEERAAHALACAALEEQRAANEALITSLEEEKASHAESAATLAALKLKASQAAAASMARVWSTAAKGAVTVAVRDKNIGELKADAEREAATAKEEKEALVKDNASLATLVFQHQQTIESHERSVCRARSLAASSPPPCQHE